LFFISLLLLIVATERLCMLHIWFVIQ